MDFLKKIRLSGFSSAALRAKARPLPQNSNPPIAAPARDWHIILLLAAAALIIVMASAAAFYWLERSGNSSGTLSGTPQSSGLSETELTAVLAHYQALDAEHAVLLQGPTAVADPAGAQ